MNMPGFNVQAQSAAPFQMLPPEVLAQLAAASFRPPALQNASLPEMKDGGGGFGLGDGLAMAGMGLRMMGNGGGGVPMGSSATTDAPGFGAGLGSSGQGILADAHKQWLAQNASNPDIANYSTLSQPDFLTGAWRKITGLF
jgi:hypothetical protein